IQEPNGIAFPAEDMDFQSASALAYHREVQAPEIWRPATAQMRAAGEVAQLAPLPPAMICVDVGSDAGSFSACVKLEHLDLPKSRRLAQTFEIIVRTPVPLRDLGDCEFVVFRGGLAQKDQVAIVVGNPHTSEPVPVRIHSSCITGDLCGSLKCDC